MNLVRTSTGLTKATEAASTGVDAASAGSRKRNHKFWGGVIGVVLPLLLWSLVARNQPEILVPTIRNTWDALSDLLSDGVLLTELGRTLLRSLSGVLIALVVGLVWGTINGMSAWAAAISRPTLSALMAVPPIIIVALGLIWLGPGASAIRLVIVLVALPLMVISVQESVQNIDHDLVEMATVFRMSRVSVFRHVIAPGITSPVLAATTVTVSQAIRVAVMAELLSSSDGVGAEISLARTNLSTSDLFAWTATLVAAVIILETFVLRPLTDHLLRWRSEPQRY